MKLLLLLIFISSCASYPGPKKYTLESNVYYTSEKSQRQMGEIYIPEGKGPFPGVIVVHGGGWSSRSFEDMENVARSLAQHGLVVFNINYRLAPKFKHPAPIEDLEAAMEVFKTHFEKYKLDPSRIGLWGYSSGGHTVSYFAAIHAKNPKLKVHAVVAGGAPFDLTWYPHSPYIKKYLGKYRDQVLDKYIEASVTEHLTSDMPPFYLYHAKGDRLVEYAQTTSFEARLRKLQVPVKSYEIGFWGHQTAFIFSSNAVKKGVKFLTKELGKK